MYCESPPPASLRRLVRCGWESVERGPKRIVPDGCVDLVAGDGEVFVAGPDTVAWTSMFPPGARLRGLRFQPGAAFAMLGVGADELRDSRIPLADLWNRRGAALADEILSGRDLADAMADVAVERAATMDPADPVDPVVERMLARLAWDTGIPGLGTASQPMHPGARTAVLPGGPRADGHSRWHPADPAGYRAEGQSAWRATPGRSERQARRLFTLAVGYGPATYRRVLRLQRAIALAPATATLADLAVAAGYSDQPHLTRECRALTGLTPRTYFALVSGNPG
ncbi:helix-turn-helix domain-containing protein [Amycolatopsis silviterrae]|uniref:Helix-turn-helix domain-containing protein n=1 Tax=Amycolatopsis silviterrae TaxID=1656914 RepID=A0ABW5HDD3_9PSEU